MSQTSKVLLRLPRALHDAVKERAAAAKLSVNSLLERYIAQGVAEPIGKDLTAEVLQEAERTLGGNVVGLLLFGSQARGDTHDSSDTDLLLVVDSNIKIERASYRHWDKVLPPDISLHITHLPTNASDAGSLWLECALDARILSDPSGRIASFLLRAKEYITSGRVVRRVTHGQGFWVPV